MVRNVDLTDTATEIQGLWATLREKPGQLRPPSRWVGGFVQRIQQQQEWGVGRFRRRLHGRDHLLSTNICQTQLLADFRPDITPGKATSENNYCRLAGFKGPNAYVEEQVGFALSCRT